ncbi:MAG: DNA topoisomerase 2 [Bathelium mastoideum]|nr:MAG: DNA topoisomerase 2 [Bathelium mastoideum]
MDSDESMFDAAASSDFEPASKAKPKGAPKKAAAATSRAKAAPKKAAPAKTKTTKAAAPKKRARPVSDNENSDNERAPASLHDDSLLSNTPPSAKKQKKAPAPKKTAAKPLQEVENESLGMDGTVEPKPASTSATDRYQKLTQLQHILKRPDTYIGSVERTEKQMWVFNSETSMMDFREVSYVPGLYKIFDEILVNAADNKHNDKNMSEIRVTVDRETGEISVLNDGRGIPIEIHAKEGIYIPEMIFGHLLTSSNYDDDQAKVTGGRNGFGAKLCNIYSTQFTLETTDSKAKKKYKQTWTENMGNMHKATITAAKGDDYTKVTFTPDFAKFGMSGMDDDFEALVKRRVYDLAGTVKEVKVYLNGQRIKIKNFKQYMELYTKSISAQAGDSEDVPTENVILTDKPNERWEIGFAVSDGSFQQVSFVNSIATTSGGTHVNYISDQIVTKLGEIVKKKKVGIKLNNNQIRNHIFLFLNAQIVNPSFTSQTKEQLTTKASQFGSKCTVSDKFLKDIAKTDAVNNILAFAEKKADQMQRKTDGGRRARMNNSKLTDANKAGTKDGYKCTLVLTEGDSASLLALAGRAVVDPDLFGVFPLRGKLLNVRDASVEQITKNQEIQNIKKFLGLQHKKEYEDTKSLRYGHLMIMTDQDHDGSHIKGLLINFLQVQFPSLLRIPGFLVEFITPIVKVWKGDIKRPKHKLDFFTMPEYEAWKEEPGHQHGWEHKYFKGLGTSSPADAEIYFADLKRHLKKFHTIKEHEEKLLSLAFSKKMADERKNWLRDFIPGTYLDMSASESITIDDFVNKELILFSMADNLRSIPSMMDGLKPGQRKILYTMFRRNLKKDQKVVELAGTVMGLTAYAYGDTSLQQTIVGLAQNFVGSNNINCLEPSGNFGSRLQGGSDAASARYIYTRLAPIARKIFHAADEPLLAYHTDDGSNIEPEMYMPVVPLVLINGADGIGTGWSTSIPNYSPEDIVENLKLRMAGTSKDDMKPMKPFFRGFTGEIEDVGGGRYRFAGKIQQTGDNEVEISELPIRMWTQTFKDKLEDIIRAEKVPSFIKDYTDYNTPEKVHFIIKMDDKHMESSLQKGLLAMFKLESYMSTTNLVCFDSQGRIQKYNTVNDILEEFYHVRLGMYQKRKQHLLGELQKELEKLTNQARFVRMICDSELVVAKKKKQVLIEELKSLNFKAFPKVKDAKKAGEQEEVVPDDEEDESKNEADNGYNYLLGMAIWSLTMERVEKLEQRIGDVEQDIDKLVRLSPKDIWNTDLDEFIEAYRREMEEEAQLAKDNKKKARRISMANKTGKKATKKRAADDSDADGDFAVVKAKKKTAAERVEPKRNGLFDFFSKQSPPSKPAGKYVLVNGREESSVPPAQTDGTMDIDEEITAPAARGGRAAARKPVKYAVSDDDSDDNGNDLLGDVSSMVKGIGPGDAGRALFRQSISRPNSSDHVPSTHTKVAPRPTAKDNVVDLGGDSDIDDTDYAKLVPKDSPQKPAARAARDIKVSDDEDNEESLDVLTAPPVKKTSKAAAATKPAAAPKPKKAPAAKATAQKATKKSASVEPESLKPVQLSPAAKAYAKKLAGKTDSKVTVTKASSSAAAANGSGRSKKKVLESDDEEDDDPNDLANDLLDDDDDEDDDMDVAPPAKARAPAKAADPAPAPAPAGRARRAAPPKKYNYAVSDEDEDEDEESEADFDDDSE